MFDIQATTKSKYYDHIVLLYLESRRCRYRSIIFACFYLYVSAVNLIVLSICKSNMPLTSVIMNLKKITKRKHNCDIEMFSLFFQFFT
jgi:hypothetical protein